VDPELDEIVTYMPQQGRCYLGSIVIQTSDDYTNDVKARIVALAGNQSHPPVTIHADSQEHLSIDENQVISFNPYELPVATEEKLGGIKLGAGLNIDEKGVVSVVTTFLGLDDVIDETYIGKSMHVPMVMANEQALSLQPSQELMTVLASLLLMSDFPNTFSGQGGKTLKVRTDELGVEFI
jgi:hypothetical protein